MPGELLEAAEDGDLKVVEETVSEILGSEMLNTNQNAKVAKMIDDADSTGKTSLMAAARGAGNGGPRYAKILKILWEAHQRCGTTKICLSAKDNRHGWNVFMHSAKCGDPTNLLLVLNMYKETFESVSHVEDDIDWANVDHKVKDLVAKEVFAGNAAPVSNYGNSSRKSRRRRKGRQPNIRTQETAASEPARGTSTARRAVEANNDTAEFEIEDEEPGPSKSTTSAKSSTPTANAKATATLKTEDIKTEDHAYDDETDKDEEEGDDAPTQSVDVSRNDDDAPSQVTEACNSPQSTAAGGNVPQDLRFCQEELKRSREDVKRQADEIERLKKAVKALAG